jgi:hypothetical protein
MSERCSLVHLDWQNRHHQSWHVPRYCSRSAPSLRTHRGDFNFSGLLTHNPRIWHSLASCRGSEGVHRDKLPTPSQPQVFVTRLYFLCTQLRCHSSRRWILVGVAGRRGSVVAFWSRGDATATNDGRPAIVFIDVTTYSKQLCFP